MGLAVLLVAIVYLAALIGLPVLAYKLSGKVNWLASRRSLAGTVVFLAIFLPVFWDWLPTVWLHSHYCDKYGGLTIIKTPEQWKQANPGVAESLSRPSKRGQVGEWPKFSRPLNQRFRLDIESREMALSLRESRERVVDITTGETLAQVVDFNTGQHGSAINTFRDIKVWMYRESCDGFNAVKQFSALSQAFEHLGDTK
jgi:hypothetical protein